MAAPRKPSRRKMEEKLNELIKVFDESIARARELGEQQKIHHNLQHPPFPAGKEVKIEAHLLAVQRYVRAMLANGNEEEFAIVMQKIANLITMDPASQQVIMKLMNGDQEIRLAWIIDENQLRKAQGETEDAFEARKDALRELNRALRDVANNFNQLKAFINQHPDDITRIQVKPDYVETFYSKKSAIEAITTKLTASKAANQLTAALDTALDAFDDAEGITMGSSASTPDSADDDHAPSSDVAMLYRLGGTAPSYHLISVDTSQKGWTLGRMQIKQPTIKEEKILFVAGFIKGGAPKSVVAHMPDKLKKFAFSKDELKKLQSGNLSFLNSNPLAKALFELAANEVSNLRQRALAGQDTIIIKKGASKAHVQAVILCAQAMGYKCGLRDERYKDDNTVTTLLNAQNDNQAIKGTIAYLSNDKNELQILMPGKKEKMQDSLNVENVITSAAAPPALPPAAALQEEGEEEEPAGVLVGAGGSPDDAAKALLDAIENPTRTEEDGEARLEQGTVERAAEFMGHILPIPPVEGNGMEEMAFKNLALENFVTQLSSTKGAPPDSAQMAVLLMQAYGAAEHDAALSREIDKKLQEIIGHMRQISVQRKRQDNVIADNPAENEVARAQARLRIMQRSVLIGRLERVSDEIRRLGNLPDLR